MGWLFSIFKSPHRGAVDFVVAANIFLFHLFAFNFVIAALSMLMFLLLQFFSSDFTLAFAAVPVVGLLVLRTNYWWVDR